MRWSLARNHPITTRVFLSSLLLYWPTAGNFRLVFPCQLSFISLTNSTTELGHYVSHRKVSLRECVRDMCLVPSVSVSNTNNEVAMIYFNIYNYTSSHTHTHTQSNLPKCRTTPYQLENTWKYFTLSFTFNKNYSRKSNEQIVDSTLTWKAKRKKLDVNFASYSTALSPSSQLRSTE